MAARVMVPRLEREVGPVYIHQVEFWTLGWIRDAPWTLRVPFTLQLTVFLPGIIAQFPCLALSSSLAIPSVLEYILRRTLQTVRPLQVVLYIHVYTRYGLPSIVECVSPLKRPTDRRRLTGACPQATDYPVRCQQTPLFSVLRCSIHAPKREPGKRQRSEQRSPLRHCSCCTPLSLALLLLLLSLRLSPPTTTTLHPPNGDG
ncbi:hypothetical protein LY76DRAFT_339122 [Colletotrichum caudatum]|nr:hypothetical protein LY76DRAFT_339122 [Colletotrichum caudatum]